MIHKGPLGSKLNMKLGAGVSYWSELAPDNCCTSTVTEADATTGWTNVGYGTFESVTEGGEVRGTKSLHVIENSASDRCYTSVVTKTGARYKINFWIKVTNKAINFLVGTIAGAGDVQAGQVLPDNDAWTEYTYYITALSAETFLTFKESGTLGSQAYIDELSVQQLIR